MTITLIDDLNKKIESKKEATKARFLTSQEGQQISQIISSYKKDVIDIYDNDLSEEDKKETFEDLKYFFNLTNYEEQVTRIKEIFTNIKQRVKGQEQKTAELLEENVLNIIKQLTEKGIEEWENVSKDLLILGWMEVSEFWKNDAETHYESIGNSEKWNKKIAADLREENKSKSQKLEENRIEINDYKSEVARLKQELQEKSEKLEEVRIENKEQKVQISQLKETLSHYSILPKKLGRFQQFKARTKTGFQKLIEKKKHQVQELIARIEVKK